MAIVYYLRLVEVRKPLALRTEGQTDRCVTTFLLISRILMHS